MAEEIKLMKGNEAIAHAAIRYGADGYFGYPITPQSEILETLMAEMPWQTTGMTVLQAESEVAAINMVYGGAKYGKTRDDLFFQPGRQPETRRYLLHRRGRTSLFDCQRHAWWSWLRNHPAQSSRLFPDG